MGAAAYGGRGFKGRAGGSGKRPIGAASCRQQRNRASCQNPLLGNCQFRPNRIFSAPTAGPTVCDRRLPPPPPQPLSQPWPTGLTGGRYTAMRSPSPSCGALVTTTTARPPPLLTPGCSFRLR